MSLEYVQIKTVLEGVLRNMLGEDEERRVSEIATHMTDWLVELQRYYDFCQDPEGYGPGEVEDMLIDFLIHVPPQVAAARKLLLGLPLGDAAPNSPLATAVEAG